MGSRPAVAGRARRLLFAGVALVAGMAVGVVAAPLEAGELSQGDARDDVMPPRADLVRLSAATQSESLALAARVARRGHPTSTWLDADVRLRWALDTDASRPGPEYHADLTLAGRSRSILHGTVRRVATGVVTCRAPSASGTTRVSSSSGEHRFLIARRCLGRPGRVRLQAAMRWDPSAGGPTVVDRAPARGWTAWLAFPGPPYRTGTSATVLTDPGRDRQIGLRVWYPLEATGPVPLVVVSHGGLGSMGSEEVLSHLGEALAERGIVAAQVGHRVSASLAQHRLDRPADVSHVIDAFEQGLPGLPVAVDVGRVGHTGHSAGAYTSMAVGGATYGYDPAGDFRDERVIAIAPLSPQGRGGFFAADDATWSTVEIPTLVLVGRDELDTDGTGQFMEVGWRLQPFAAFDASADRIQVVIDGLDHLAMGGQGSAEVKDYLGRTVAAFFDHMLNGRGDACRVGSDDPPATVVISRTPATTGSALTACPATVGG